MNAPARLSVHALLAQARVGLDRLTPVEAYEAVRAGAVLIDIRPTLSRNAEGRVPGALVIERNELEWRLDPARRRSRRPTTRCTPSSCATRATRQAWPQPLYTNWGFIAPAM